MRSLPTLEFRVEQEGIVPVGTTYPIPRPAQHVRHVFTSPHGPHLPTLRSNLSLQSQHKIAEAGLPPMTRPTMSRGRMQSLNLLWICIAPFRKDRQLWGLEKYIPYLL